MTSAVRESSSRLCAGRLCVDPRSKEAWKDGEKVPVGHQSLEILIALMERPGEIVTREELRRRLWPEGTFVDFEHSLNAAIKKLRVALGDSAERPQFIETLPRVGYRLLDTGDSTQRSPATGSVGRRSHRATWFAAAAAVLAISAVTWLWMRSPRVAPPAERLSVQRLTSLGTVVTAAISPDGKYLSYITADDPTQSLWVQQVGMANELMLRRQERGPFWGQKFSRDGRFIYYGVRTIGNPAGALFRIPTLGGAPQELLTGIDSEVGFSPDGSRIAFLRAKHPTIRESSLLIANADGTDVRVRATRRAPEAFAPIFFNAPSWSPDGKWIACSTRNARRGGSGTIRAFRVDSSEETILSGFPWTAAFQVEWLPDGSGLIAVASDAVPRVPQLWFVPIPQGRPERITADLRQYRLVELTADGRSLVTVAMERVSTLWRVPLSTGGIPVKVTNFRLETSTGVASGRGGEIFLGSIEDGPRLWVLSADGTQRRPFRSGDARDANPAVSPSGKHVAFVTEGDSGLWLVAAASDGSRIRRMARAARGIPAFTPDGKEIVFTAPDRFLYTVPLEGGIPTRLTSFPATSPAISPDGRSVAAYCASSGQSMDLCVFPLGGRGAVMRLTTFIDPEVGALAWTAGGKEVLSYAESDFANVYAYPLDGSAPRRVTSFADERVMTFAIEQGGASLLVFRTRLLRDAYLITGFRSRANTR